ncbi:DUF6883 domain-containing protein [Methylobacterium sp. J-070]|uniref:DUF6883 domain-containing protein n=1 Tax=Methylobacterium sp. J-070 TaxID=2836650 RepID=UPI001FB8E093|nr:DUF6883 domain-containing protein [Methylobacterium sp. J-070]MCJ2050849.1 hypothetical protein [Methylobacterium sp. J-070]
MNIGEEDWPSRFHIAPAKITAYLHNPDHRDGAAKCRFLAAFGFTPRNPDDLRDALLGHCRRTHFQGVLPGYQAVKLCFEGPLAALIGIDPQVRTVWQVDEGDPSRTARFITLKPLPRARP